MTNEDTKRFAQRLNDAVDGGGCTQAWEAAQTARDGDGRRLSRRGVLAATAGATGTAAVPTAAAEEPASERIVRRQRASEAVHIVREEYEPSDLRSTVLDAGAETLRELADRGLIGSADLTAFADGLPEDGIAFQRDGVGIAPQYNHRLGVPSADLSAVAETSDHQIHLHVKPESGRQEALVVPKDGTNPFVVEPTVAPTGRTALDDGTVQYDSCSTCATVCAVFCGSYPVTRGVCDADVDCTSVLNYPCNRDPTCDECPDMSGCNSSW